MLPRTMSATESMTVLTNFAIRLGVVHEEHHDVVDQLAGLDERRRRVEQADQPGDAGGDDLGDDEVLDLLEDHLLDVAELLHAASATAPPTPPAGDDLEDLDALLDRGHRLLADLLDDPVADVAPRSGRRVEASSLMMPLRSNVSGSSTPPSASAPNSQPIRPLRRWSRMLSLNLRMPPLIPAIRLPRKPTGCLDDVAHHAGHPGEHVLEHRGELADRVDDRP